MLVHLSLEAVSFTAEQSAQPAQLRAGRANPVQRLTARFIKNGNLANNEVIALGFNYCRFKLSRYE